MSTAINTAQSKPPAQIRSDGLRTLKNGLIGIGIASPNVGPGSPPFVQWTALANEIAVGQANGVVSTQGNMPDTATGANLDRWGAIVNRPRRTAVGSHGNATVYNSAPGGVNYTTGAVLTDSAGQTYEVIAGALKSNEQTLSIAAISAGASTNHANGDTLSWVDQPPFSGPTVTVGALGGTDGLVDGADSEVGNDELYRPRVLAAFSSPDKDGNESRVAHLATLASDQVGTAYVYPALQGPGTCFVAGCATPQAVGPFTSTSKSRVVPGAIMSGTVLPFLLGALGGQPYLQAFSTVDAPATLAIQIFLPSSPSSSPPGPGGGWLDAAPWPPSVGSTTTAVGTGPVQVTAIASTTVFTVSATTAPVVGVSRIACLSDADWTLYNATVLAVSGPSGAYVVTVDTPFPFIALGDVIFPQCVNQQAYVDAIFASFAAMGPGEWTTNAGALARAFRHPAASLSNLSSLSNAWLKPLISAGPEVGDALFIPSNGRQTGSYGSYSPVLPPYVPAVPASVATAPNIFTPAGIGLYPI